MDRRGTLQPVGLFPEGRGGAGSAAPVRLRVLTYNVHSCIGTDRKIDPARIADVIAACRPDIVGLQELDVGRRRTGGVDQAVTIARHLSMEPHFHATLTLEEERYGDAVLSRFPSRLIKAEALPSTGEQRGALAVEAEIGGQGVVVLNTHLGLRRRERVRQAETLIGPSWLRHPEIRDKPVIVMGDLNAGPRSPAYRLLTRHLSDAATAGPGKARATFPSRWPLLRIDHILLVGGLSAAEARVVCDPPARRASDHLPLLAEMDLMPQGATAP